MTPAGSEPLAPEGAKKRIRRILESGEVRFSQHARDEMARDQLTAVDCVSVLRGGTVRPPEFERGSWRYRVFTSRICVVVAFRSEHQLVVVTAWRIQR
ncbi:MAG: DUF4258 domain-containing protein [candidate division NC10 bacterium]|jgi:plasmid stabilization system protein ParE|nr:MAG: hypothetical protein A3K12_05035 [Candidatus Rokubacteria bacterium RIFCSPLOWO2_12_FULL_71_19]